MFELAKPKVKMSDLSHRVALCTMHDVIDKDGAMHLIRSPVMWIWAYIDNALNLPSFISPDGFAFRESYDAWKSHRIIIRAQSGVQATSAAWVYEMRLKSPPRWYKVLGFNESDAWLLLITHLIERSDNAVPPAISPFAAQPSKVPL